MAAELVEIVEIDMDYCSRTFGVLPCTAALSANVPWKCWNTWKTCKAPSAFLKGVKTLRFVSPRANMPKSAATVYFPALKSVTAIAGAVNLSGIDAEISAFGRRATFTAEVVDWPYHDRELDKYAKERVSGAAQFDGVGYDPAGRGTFFAKLRARWPHYINRPLRYILADISSGSVVVLSTRLFLLTNIVWPDDGGVAKIEAQDILTLAGNDRAVAPAAGQGSLAADISASATSATLSPAGVGATYATSGRLAIGGEVVSFTRSGDALTLTGRGLSGTVAAGHSTGDGVQPVLSFVNARVDDVVEILLRDFAAIPSAYIPKTTWAAEVSRWAPNLRLTRDICSPQNVAQLVGELAVLGVLIWWDLENQLIRLKMNRPLDGEAPLSVSDRNSFKAVAIEDRAKDRLTEVYIFSVQKDPTGSVTDQNNYRRILARYDMASKGANAYGDTRVKKIFCPWFNAGADDELAIAAGRILSRFRDAPARLRATLDAKDRAATLGAVVLVDTAAIVAENGLSAPRTWQVISRNDAPGGAEFEIIAQDWGWNGRYGWATPDSWPSYASATPAQKAAGNWAVDATLTFSDFTKPYEAI